MVYTLNMAMPPFHLAFPVDDLESARTFYHGLLGCRIGRESSNWIDFDFFGHQATAHLTENPTSVPTNAVDGDEVPVRHFGVVLPIQEWDALAAHLARKGVKFLIKPHVRFQGEPGEQATMFICDPAGNALEFKAFKNPEQLFARC